MALEANYIIETKTEEGRKRSATDSSVFIKIIGEKARAATDWILLDNWLRDDFEEGRVDVFNVQATNVLIPKVIGLRIDKKEVGDGWFCERVVVENRAVGKQVEFNVYNWLLTELWVVAGEETLPQKETCPFIKDVRKREIENNKSLFKWLPRPCSDGLGWGLPRFCNAETVDRLPLLFHNSDDQVLTFDGTRQLIRATTLKEYLSGKFGFGSQINEYDDFMNVLKGTNISLERPRYYGRWQEDVEFGRSTLNGTNPFTLQQITKLPSGLNISEREIDGLLDDNMTLEKAFSMKRMYAIDYRSSVKGLPRNIRTKSRAQLHSSDPVVLLYVKNSKDFVPIVIQLEDDDPEKVFTPKDTKDDWLLAKMYFKSVDVAIHEWVSHYLNTHAVMEPVAVSMFRNLSCRHPLYKLLRDHLVTVAAINTQARKDLLGPDSSANQCIGINSGGAAARAYKTLRYENLNVPKMMKSKGLCDPNELPNYYYRDDVFKLWYAIEDYIKRIISIFYKENKDVAEDGELQSWTEDVAVEGIGWQDGDTKGFPRNINSIDQLVEYVTIIVFTCSVQHAAINFGQFETYKFLPSTPGAMRLPSHRRGEGTKDRIMKSLPDAVMAVLQLGVSYLLSQYSKEDVFLGEYRQELFVNGAVLLTKERFKRELTKIEESIKKRNEGLEVPYVVLLPSKIPISIAS